MYVICKDTLSDRKHPAVSLLDLPPGGCLYRCLVAGLSMEALSGSLELHQKLVNGIRISALLDQFVTEVNQAIK